MLPRRPLSEGGDGSVSAERSARNPARQGKPRISYRQTGYEHQDSFQDDKVIACTLHGICKIAHEAFAWRDQ